MYFSEVVILATPWTAAADAFRQIASPPQNKALWDCTNPLKPDLSGLLVGTNTSGAEEVAKLAPWAHVVKALPPFAELMHSSDMTVGGKQALAVKLSDAPTGDEFCSGRFAGFDIPQHFVVFLLRSDWPNLSSGTERISQNGSFRQLSQFFNDLVVNGPLD